MSWDPFHHDPDPRSVLRKIFAIIFFLKYWEFKSKHVINIVKWTVNVILSDPLV